MVKRDLLKEQIEQAGRVLAKILTDFAGMRTTASVNDALQTVQQQLRTAFDFDLEPWLDLDPDARAQHFATLEFSEAALDRFAAFLFELGVHYRAQHDPDRAQRYFRGARTVLDRVDAVSETLTFERMDLRAAVERAIATA